jgi:hypothetical protein
MLAYLRSLGWTEWQSFIGIRYDEPRRWKIRGPSSRFSGEWRELPLVDAGVTRVDVAAFWGAQPFDLGLESWQGNCDLCFMKGRRKIERAIRDDVTLADWWIAQENAVKSSAKWVTFRSDRPSYAAMKKLVIAQPLLPLIDDAEDAPIDCMCTD